MAWMTIKANDGIYNVDWQTVSRLIRSYVRSEAILKYSKENVEGHWVGPDLHTIDVDWDKVKRETDEKSEMLLRALYGCSQSNMRPQIAHLLSWVDQTRLNNGKFQAKMRQAQRTSMHNIDSSVVFAERSVKVLEFTRDSSAEFLMVSATIVSGGTAAAFAAGGGLVVGAGLKTTAKYQDAKFQGHDPSKIPTTKQLAGFFAVEFGVGLLDLAGAKYIGKMAKAAEEAAKLRGVGHIAAKAAEKGTEMGLAILWNVVKGATVEPGKGIVEGKLLNEGDGAAKGFVAGGLKSAGGTHGEILKYFLSAQGERGKILSAFGDTAISLAADHLAEQWTSTEGPEAGGREPHVTILTPRTGEQRLVDAIAYERSVVERTAIYQVGTAAPPNYAPPLQSKSSLRPLRFHPAAQSH